MDFNGSKVPSFEDDHDGLAFGERNLESGRILEFTFANNLVSGNSWFLKNLNF